MVLSPSVLPLTLAVSILSHIHLEVKVTMYSDFPPKKPNQNKTKKPLTQSFYKPCTFLKKIGDKSILRQSKQL